MTLIWCWHAYISQFSSQHQNLRIPQISTISQTNLTVTYILQSPRVTIRFLDPPFQRSSTREQRFRINYKLVDRVRSRAVETMLSINSPFPSFQRGGPAKDRLGDYRYGGQWEASGNWNTAYSRCSLDIISVYEHLSRRRGNHRRQGPMNHTLVNLYPFLHSLSLSLQPLFLSSTTFEHWRRHLFPRTLLSRARLYTVSSVFLRFVFCSSFSHIRAALLSYANVCLDRDAAQRFWEAPN